MPADARASKSKKSRQHEVRYGGFHLFSTGAARFDLSDPFHLIATISWPAFFACLLGSELLINTMFAFLYVAVPGAIANVRPGNLADAFFFSIETLATVGYGAMVPATLYGHIVSSVEIVTGMVYAACMTGVVFIRFSKPRPKIVYADRPVVANYNGAPTLMIRLANGRANPLTDASVRLYALMTERTAEGHIFRGAKQLTLARPHFPLFALIWTLMHRIDEGSPLYGSTSESMAADAVRLILIFEAHDPAVSTHVHDLKGFMPESVAFGMRYSDAVHWDEQGRPIADLARISDLEPDVAHQTQLQEASM
jgi:inward rectifier potassium channel